MYLYGIQITCQMILERIILLMSGSLQSLHGLTGLECMAENHGVPIVAEWNGIIGGVVTE